MKLLVVAQTPPPAHGQSLAVAALLEHLRADANSEVHHVNLPLSRNAADIGRWRAGKMIATVAAARRARRLLREHGPMPLYYVPAPAKRGALYRDWTILAFARPRTAGLILHWHAVGLGSWVTTQATPPERALTRRYLGRASLAIVQADACRADALLLEPRACVTVRNGVPDPWPDFTPKPRLGSPCEVLFVGLGCAEKGLFDALEGVRLANLAQPGAFRFTALGPFASARDAEAFHRACASLGDTARHAGFVSVEERNQLFRRADVLTFPSYYPYEGQPAVILEALAHDLPIVTTRWRGIPEHLPERHVHYVDPRAPEQIAAALQVVRDEGPAGGTTRAGYLETFTQQRHLVAVKTAISNVLRP